MGPLFESFLEILFSILMEGIGEVLRAIFRFLRVNNRGRFAESIGQQRRRRERFKRRTLVANYVLASIAMVVVVWIVIVIMNNHHRLS